MGRNGITPTERPPAAPGAGDPAGDHPAAAPGAAAPRRRWTRRVAAVLLALGLILLAIRLVSNRPSVYVRLALWLIENRALGLNPVAWPETRRQVLARAAGARTTRDTYPALRQALAALGDGHSHLLSPEAVAALDKGRGRTLGLLAAADGTIGVVHAGSPAEKAGLRPGDRVVEVDGTPFAPRRLDDEAQGGTRRLTVQPATGGERRQVTLEPAEVALNLPPRSERLTQGGPALGYLEVPGLDGDDKDQRYAGALARALRGEPPLPPSKGKRRRLARPPASAKPAGPPPCGWIVDLRRNAGGNMWPMIHGLRALFGRGTPGYFVVGVEGTRHPWIAEQGGRTDADGPGAAAGAPVAVVQSRLTASAGEAVAIAFRGRPEARSFGEPTAGLPTVTGAFPLPDGARLMLTVGRHADRAGQVYRGPIAPDETVTVDWTKLGTADDPVVAAAARWLWAQPACAGGK